LIGNFSEPSGFREHLPFYDAIVSGLAQLRHPDLAGFDSDYIDESLALVYDQSGLNKGYISWIMDRVAAFSDGNVHVEPANMMEFPEPVPKEWGTVYFRLVGTNVDRLVALVNSIPPVIMVPVAKNNG
jgi:hypothetical protein